MLATTRRLVAGLDLPPPIPFHRPQYTDLLKDIMSGQATTATEFDKLISRCYADSLYDEQHAIHPWRSERETLAKAVVIRVKDYGFTYNERSRSFSIERS